jgi:hypothetical protein
MEVIPRHWERFAGGLLGLVGSTPVAGGLKVMVEAARRAYSMPSSSVAAARRECNSFLKKRE